MKLFGFGKKESAENSSPDFFASLPTDYDKTISGGLSKLKQKYPDFSDFEFCEKVSNILIRIFSSVEDKDYSPVKPYISDYIIGGIEKEIQYLKKENLTHRFDKLSVLNRSFSGCRISEEGDFAAADLTVRMTDYVIDGEGKIISGSKASEKFITYRVALSKNKKFSSYLKVREGAQNCPNCGAPVNINFSAVCEYCSSILYTDDFDWIIEKISVIDKKEVTR